MSSSSLVRIVVDLTEGDGDADPRRSSDILPIDAIDLTGGDDAAAVDCDEAGAGRDLIPILGSTASDKALALQLQMNFDEENLAVRSADSTFYDVLESQRASICQRHLVLFP